MNNEKKMELLVDILDIEAEELTPETRLVDMEEWDSIAALSFIAMMDEEFGKEFKGADVKKIVTVQDALNVMEE